jgi:uncharacterized membrane protein YcjF (UPF0283 family)
MDWMTLTITSIGAVIFCLWVIIPIREYQAIYRRLRDRLPERNGHAARSGDPHDDA